MFCAGLLSIGNLLTTGKKNSAAQRSGPQETHLGLLIQAAFRAGRTSARKGELQQAYDKSAPPQFQLKPAIFALM
jgi:hypothetical protein